MNLKYDVDVITRRSLHQCLVLCIGLCLLADAGAQEPIEDDEIRGRKAWFVQTSIPKDVDNPVKVLINDEVRLVSLYNRVASRAVPIPDEGDLRIVKEVPDPEDPAKVKYLTLARALIPPGMNNALVILTPVRERKEDGLVFMTKVVSLQKFKGGDFMYINLTSAQIGVEIDKDKMLLKPGNMKIQQVGNKDKPVSVPYRYSYYHPDKEKWMPLNASMTIATSTRRQLFIFSVNEHTGRVRCKGITFPVKQPEPG